jgi:hypothetical protein
VRVRVQAVVAVLLVAVVGVSGTAFSASAAFAAAKKKAPAPAPVKCVANPTKAGYVKAENLKAGSTGWTYHPTKATGIEAFASVTSASCGQIVRLFVSTPAPTTKVTAWRMGYYGNKGARPILTSGAFKTAKQSKPVIDKATRSPHAAWKLSYAMKIDGRFVPGSYLLKFTDSKGGQAYVPLVITDPTSHAPLAMMSEPLTWQAYNGWGGASAYNSSAGRDKRSLVTSLDRPLSGNHGMATYMSDEYPLIWLMESRGLDTAYMTELDVHVHPEILRNHRAVVLGAHAEYWSPRVRGGFDAARNAGVNIALFGANTGYWQVRPMNSSFGANRSFAIYRDPAIDPVNSTAPQTTSTLFRALPNAIPESQLFGEQYQGCPGLHADMILSAPAWPFPAGMPAGSVLPLGVRQEFDRAGMSSAPAGVQIMATSPVVCQGQTAFANVTYYTAPSGAGVFAAGTLGWVCQLYGANSCAYGGTTAPISRAVITLTTMNLLTAMTAGPLGRSQPSVGTGVETED